jgi:hypothetical protein
VPLVSSPTSRVTRHRVARRWLLAVVLIVAASAATTAEAVTAHRHAVAIFSPSSFDRAVSTEPQALVGRTIAVSGLVARVWGAGPTSSSPLRFSGRADASDRLLVLVGDVTLDCRRPTRVDFLRGDAVQVIGQVASCGRTAGAPIVGLTRASVLPKDAAGPAGESAPVFYLDPRYGFRLTYASPLLRLAPGQTADGVYRVRVEPPWASADAGLSSFVLVGVGTQPADVRGLLRSTVPGRARLLAAKVERLLAATLRGALPSDAAITDTTALAVDLDGLPAVRCRFTVAIDKATAWCSATALETNGRVVCAETFIAPGDDARVVTALCGAGRSLALSPSASPASSAR